MACGKKNAQDEQRTILWGDESSFSLLPHAVRTYAPKGHTPILRVKLTHDHLSAISALGMGGTLTFALQDHAYTSDDVIAVLKQVLMEVPGKLTVIWDGAPIHRSKAIKAFLAEGAAHRLHLEQLPGYAPDLNPDEGVWNWLKHVDLKNHCFATLPHLEAGLLGARDRLQNRHDVLTGCVQECGYLV